MKFARTCNFCWKPFTALARKLRADKQLEADVVELLGDAAGEAATLV